MRSSVVVLLATVGWACGGGRSVDVSSTTVAADAALAIAPTPVSAVPLGTKLGIVFTANVLGELEPCG